MYLKKTKPEVSVFPHLFYVIVFITVPTEYSRFQNDTYLFIDKRTDFDGNSAKSLAKVLEQILKVAIISNFYMVQLHRGQIPVKGRNWTQPALTYQALRYIITIILYVIVTETYYYM